MTLFRRNVYRNVNVLLGLVFLFGLTIYINPFAEMGVFPDKLPSASFFSQEDYGFDGKDFEEIVHQKFEDVSQFKIEAKPPENVTFNPEQVRIEILAYKRGGSSFIGELFNRNRDAWYIFEPMAFLMSRAIPSDLRYTWQIMEYYPYERLDEKYKFYTNHLAAVLNCSFSNLLMQYYISGTQARNSPHYFNPRLFVAKSEQLKKALLTPTATNVRSRCLRKPIVVSKTIRMLHAAALERYFPKDNWIIHLVRDPRAIAVSRKQKSGPGKLCKIIADNLEVSLQMEADNQKWITMRYEDLAFRPVENSEKLYSRLGLTMPEEVKSWIVANTNAERNDAGEIVHKFNYAQRGLALSTSRDAKTASQHWIKDISPNMALSFDSSSDCQFIYRTLGYRNYTYLIHELGS